MTRLGRSDPITNGGIMVSQEKPSKAAGQPKPKMVQTSNIDVAMTNSSTMR